MGAVEKARTRELGLRAPGPGRKLRGSAPGDGSASSLSFRSWEQREKWLPAALLGPRSAESKVPHAQ